MARPNPTAPRLAAAALASLLATAGPAAAQLPEASASALGLGGNFTALARGHDAAAWNPSALGLDDGPAFSIGVMQVHGVAGIFPVELADINRTGGEVVPRETKERWLDRITDAGGQQGAFGSDLTYLALNVGRLGFQLSSTVRGRLDLEPDAAEVLLFGNAGRDGEPRTYAFAGSRFDASATSTVAVSWAQPVPLAIGSLLGQSLSLGATLKYTVGHALVSGWDAGSAMESDPVAVRIDFPVIQTDSTLSPGLGYGSGVGLDLAATWQGGPLTAAVVVRNAINTFAWNEERLYYRAGAALFAADTSSTDFEPQPLESAPAPVRDRAAELVAERNFPPTLAAGIGFEVLPTLTLTADVRHRLDEGMALGPETHAGLGAEFRAIPFLPLRAGVARVTGGHQISGGLGVELGPLQVGLALARRRSDAGSDGLGALSVSFGTD